MSFDIKSFAACFKLCQQHLGCPDRILTSEEYIQTRLLGKECYDMGYKVETLLKVAEILAGDDQIDTAPIHFRELCRAVNLIREKKNISTNAMIERMGMDRGNYYKLFRSNQESCSLHLILRFAAALDSTPSYIFEIARSIGKIKQDA